MNNRILFDAQCQQLKQKYVKVEQERMKIMKKS